MLTPFRSTCGILLTVGLAGLFGGIDTAAAGPCPGDGDCCEANGTLGCDNYACCNLICSTDFSCCDIGWTQRCANLASAICDPGACASECPGSGDCCQEHDSPACNDTFCCDLVCTQDSFCCEGIWTADCTELAGILCPDLCSPPAACPGEGSCCLSSDTGGCDDGDCCATICDEDDFCCTVDWDSICADSAEFLCASLCGGPCPAPGDCCSEHGTPGCADTSCCGAVCAANASCCDVEWNSDCAALADSLCPELCGGACPGAEDCCEMHDSSGCNDAACCDLVCEVEQFCCFLGWDFNCILAAGKLCSDLCLNPPVCPGDGDCCVPGGTPGCDDTACCKRVCAANSGCCTGGWDATCVALAVDLCGRTCRCASFGDLDENGTVDLADVAWFQRCFSGANGGPVGIDCACGDVAGNDDVDLIDLRAFLQALRGP